MKRITRERTHWGQSMCDLRISANVSGLTGPETDIAEAIYDVIPQYRVAARQLASGKVYTRIAPQVGGHRDLDANCGAAYIWRDGALVTICHNTPVYRMHRMVEAFDDYLAGRIDGEVWSNYSHGGYLSRAGLYRTKRSEKMERVSMSHMLIDATGKAGHDARVAIR